MKNKKGLIGFVILLAIILIGASGWYFFSNYDFESGEVRGMGEEMKLSDNYVVRVIDGDTFEIGSGEIVRLLCIDTPEKGKEGYEGATFYLEGLILDEEVVLEVDAGADVDKYGRLLRYVYLNDTFINKEIYANGYAEMLVIPPADERCSEIEGV